MKFTAVKKLVRSLSVAAVACMTFAGAAFAEGTSASAAGSNSGTIQFIISMVVLFAIFYFLMIRPENKRKKKVEEMRSSLGVGDDIVTIGGIQGKIVNISGDSITFETGEDRVRVKVAKWAISGKGGEKKQ